MIEVPLEDSDKVVLVVRIDRGLVPAPIVTDGSIQIRLDGRNVRANRQMMASLLAAAGADHSQGFMGRYATRSPHAHRPFRQDQRAYAQPAVHLRAITSVALPLGRRRLRLATGMHDTLISALSETELHHLTERMGVWAGGNGLKANSWHLERASSREIELWLSSSPRGIALLDERRPPVGWSCVSPRLDLWR
ncbi:hypothetical protein [Streptomyces sp. NPDC059398]|uniref:hypothetical protein n=1 Tax=Streptomyces sp. NPDC059398 TaxID=3346820 RepID=UPI0036A5DF8E